MLALIFMVAVAGIVGGLTDLVMNDVRNTSQFALNRSDQYAASSATDLAIQSIRYTPLLATDETLNASPPSYCWGSGPVSETPSVNGVPQMSVWCSTSWSPTSASTRVVTLSTCPSTTSAAACAAHPALQAVVTFDDYGPGVSSPSSAECVVYCGAGMTLDSWLWSPVVPTVTGISTASGAITGGTSLTITGTGFVGGATSVNFIAESGGTPADDNYVAAGTSVSVVSSTSITARSPAVTEGKTFFVTVTTPTGSSAYGPVFTYSLVSPTITSISDGFPTGGNAASGSTAGGNSVTITGTGFYAGATINFVEESSGSAISPTVSIPSNYVSVVSPTSITTTSPGVINGTTYFVTVTTSGGTSSFGSSSSDVFDYSELIPIVASVSPNTGSAGTTVTITGTGFYSGATVYFGVNSTCGTSNPATTSSVVSSTTMTAIAPVVSGHTYCITVQNTGTAASSNTVLFST